MTPMGETAWAAPSDLDPECVALCAAINECLPGVETVESCCAHGMYPYRIWVWPESLDALPPLLYWLDHCHTGLPGWSMQVYTDCAADHCTFMIEGPAGAYAESGKIAAAIRLDAHDAARCSDCGINTLPRGGGAEYYMVHDDIWASAGMTTGYLCVGCLEARLGRRLSFADVPLNSFDPSWERKAWYSRTERLTGRLSGPQPAC